MTGDYLEKKIFSMLSEVPEDLGGKLLLADPSLREGLFHRSVIFLAEHSAEDGAFGIVLNRPSGKKVGELLKGGEFRGLEDVPVHLGGPVSEENLMFGAMRKNGESLDFRSRISAQEASKMVGEEGVKVVAYAGYAGWSKDQLEEEIENQAWFVTAASGELMRKRHDIALWKSVMSELSPLHRILAEAPDEILAN